MRSITRKATTFVSTIALAASIVVAPACAQGNSEQVAVNVEAQRLDTALNALARQYGMQVVIYSEDANSRQVAALNGSFTLTQALDRMLAGTGLEYIFINGNTIAVGTPERLNAVRQAERNPLGALPAARNNILVTGSRLFGVEPTSQTVVITREEIETRGYTSAEEILSSLPQFFGGLNSASTSLDGFNNDLNTGLTQGQSAANLRGLGASNVLVLVNGRRTSASSALALFGQDTSLNATNLATIPFAAVERVEIILDGASAIYGADAVGGVINFVLRSDFNGGEIGAFYETGEAGGDQIQLTGVFGKTWTGGFLTISGEYSHTDRVLADDIGFTTNDRSALFNDPLAFDQRFLGSPLLISTLDVDDIGALRPGDNGDPITDDDLDGTSGRLTLDPAHRLFDGIEPEVFPDSERWTINLSGEHEILTNLSLFVDGSYSWNQTTERKRPISDELGGFEVKIPPGSPFNASSETLEIEGFLPFGVSDLLDDIYTVSTSKRLSVGGGLEYRFADGFFNGWRARGQVSFDRSENEIQRFNELGFDEDIFEALIASGDVNPFTDLTTQDAFAQAVSPGNVLRDRGEPSQSELTQVTLDFEGPLFALPGGISRLAFGGELRWEGLNLNETFLFGNDPSFQFPLTTPSRDLIAVFGEVNLPLVGSSNDIPLIDSFEINLAGRFDSYTAQAETNLATIDNRYEKFSPRIGVAWRPVSSLKLRGNWQKSFRAPTIRQLFIADRRIANARSGRFVDPSFFFNTPFGDVFFPGDRANAPTFQYDSVANPNLKGERSESWSAGADWDVDFIPGLRLSVNYNHTKIADAFSRTQDILAPDPSFLAVGPLGLGTIDRDANGYIIAIREQPLNISSFTSETIDFFVDYQTSTPIGELGFILNSSHIIKNERVLVENADGIVPDFLRGTDRAPSNWQHFAEARLKTGATTFVVTMNYVGEFTNVGAADLLATRALRERNDVVAYLFDQVEPFLIDVSNPNSITDDTLVQEVGSFVTFDAIVQHEFRGPGLRLSIGAKNLFDERPPYYASDTRVPFSPAKHDPRGRRIFVKATKEF